MSIWTGFRTAIAKRLGDRSRTFESLGKRGELAAERYLKRRGYRIVACGYKNHIGEVDLIAVDQRTRPRTIVFVEVKTRRSDSKGLPVEAVDDRKQRQVCHTAMVYLKRHDLLECRFRFDIIGILWPHETTTPQIQHYVDAFPPVGQGQMFQ